MKVAWAHRTTRCLLCRDEIAKKTVRLDDTWQIRKDPIKIRRIHYHPTCYFKYVEEWSEKHPYKKLTSNGARPALDLTATQRKRRHQLLSGLSALIRYYFPLGKEPLVDLQKSFGDMTNQDLRRLSNYHRRYDKILLELKDVGGAPSSWKLGG